MIKHACSQCGYVTLLPTTEAGRIARCPKCGKSGVVESPAAPTPSGEADAPQAAHASKLAVVCRTCGGRLKVSHKAEGKHIQCPLCRAVVDVPAGDSPRDQGELDLAEAVKVEKTPRPREGGTHRFSECRFCRGPVPKGALKCMHCGQSLGVPGPPMAPPPRAPTGYRSPAGRNDSTSRELDQAAVRVYYAKRVIKVAACLLAVAAITYYFRYDNRRTLTGTACVKLDNGQTQVLSNMDVYLLPRTVDHNFFLNNVYHPGLSQVSAGDEKQDEEQKAKYQRLGIDIDVSMCETFFDDQKKHISIGKYTPIRVAQTVTGPDGRFELKDIKGGKYYLAAHQTQGQTQVSWLIPVEITKDMTVDMIPANVLCLGNNPPPREMASGGSSASAIHKPNPAAGAKSKPTGKVNVTVTWRFNEDGAPCLDAHGLVFLLPDTLPRPLDGGLLIRAQAAGLSPQTKDMLQHSGIYADTVDAQGRANIENVPGGKYTLLIISGSSAAWPQDRGANDTTLRKFFTGDLKLIESKALYTESLDLPEGGQKQLTHDFGLTAF